MWAQLRPHLPVSVETLETKASGHAIGLAAEALKKGAKLVIAVGGDGTVNEVVNGFFEGERPIAPDASLGIIPQGTGSDFIRTLKLPLDPRKAAEIIHRGVAKPIDVARVSYMTTQGASTTRYFINVTSFGMGGAVAANAKRYSKVLGGRVGFLVATLVTMLRFSGNTVTLRLDGSKTIEAKITNVAIGNGQFHGAGMWVCPHALLDDGVLDVSVIRYLGLFETIRDLSMLYNGRIYEHPKVEFHRSQRIEAGASEPTLIEIDGEPLGKLPVDVTILPGAITVLTN